MDKDRHKFQKSFIEDPNVETKVETKQSKEESLVEKFAWDDTKEDTAEDFQPEFDSVTRISDCITVIAGYVSKNIKAEHAILGEDEVALKMYIPIDESLHPLLEDRYSALWTEESRLFVFEFIKGMFRQYWDESARLALEVALDDLFPSQGQKRHSIDSIELWDEPVAAEDGAKFGVEIQASYVAKVAIE